MNILMIGNGFDIAHGLETKYGDFLLFLQRFDAYYLKRVEIEQCGGITNHGGRRDLECIEYLILMDTVLGERLHNNMQNNLWVDYFLNIRDHDGRWLDFEIEIERVLMEIDDSIGSGPLRRQVEEISNDFFQKYIDQKKKEYHGVHHEGKEQFYTYDALLEKLRGDFIRLTDALEIYLFIYVERYGWRNDKVFKRLPVFDKVLSFNYTDTYMRLYDTMGSSIYSTIYKNDVNIVNEMDIRSESKDVMPMISPNVAMRAMSAEYCFVHGRVRYEVGNRYPDRDNHIILGISDEEEKNAMFIGDEKRYHDFQKYMLRGRYGERGYEQWLEAINDNNTCELHIIGHSLAYSDRDILIRFLLHPNVDTTIYYLDDEAKKNLIENLQDLIGKEKFKQLFNDIRIKCRPVTGLY